MIEGVEQGELLRLIAWLLSIIAGLIGMIGGLLLRAVYRLIGRQENLERAHLARHPEDLELLKIGGTI